MFSYYLQLALHSFRRSPGLTALMVIIMGIGVAASMTTYAVFRAVSGDPLPDKSAQLFVPQIDNAGPQNGSTRNHLPDALTYTDAMALMQAKAGTRQTAVYPITGHIEPSDGLQQRPFSANGYAAYADFFAMFDVPFQYGHGWSSGDDDRHTNVIAISSRLNQRLFAGINSVGRILHLDGHDYRVVGVIHDWNPQPRFFDVNNGFSFGGAPDYYLPFTRAIDLHISSNGNNNCSGSAKPVTPGWDGWLRSECVWVSLWVELPHVTAVQRYQRLLSDYAAEQQRHGRFQWASNVRLFDLNGWLDHEGVVPPETKVSVLVAGGFLLVCLVNTVGLLLAKIMRRAGEVGVRRALGASRGHIYAQFLVEAAAIGVAGGLLGLLLTAVGMHGTALLFEPGVARLARLTAGLVGLTVWVAVSATVLAGLYPAWRAARVQPSWQLKSQ
ncbi:ABC transporter permease [Dyella nitratireducens]|uniref:ABC transporter ATP-binding protein n=1 Tax=Dyella nitratireducens TaxID=1849580 RepID=A0ABQ1FQY4_9GAMM|nr:ABC transporter permease [Dyella nitratireducens]GGA24695.1 ABC transporter ATP-binding protein [Dyella nitratireducens]GLQ43790.1 ABC transporter ATP-binding protein [Dyella nitratireducens]